MTLPSVLLADDHPVFAEGVKTVLTPHLDVVAVVSDGHELLEAAGRLKPDLIVTDISMPRLNGLDAIKQLHREGKETRIICLTMHCDVVYAARAIRAGAAAFVLKQSAGTELLEAVREVLQGRTYITPSLQGETQRLLSEEAIANGLDELLTVRQREVLQLFAEGYTAKEVGAILHISPRTAENHKAQIMRFLGVSSTAELVKHAIRIGLIPAP